MIVRPDYENSIVNITATILREYGDKTNHNSLRVLEQEFDKGFKHLVLILLDGMGVNIVKKFLKEEDVLKKNMISELTSVFPSTTTAATTSILSGLTPYESGIMGWFQYFKEYDTYYTIFRAKDYYNDEKEISNEIAEKLVYTTFLDRIKKVDSGVETKLFYPIGIDINGYEDVGEGLNSVVDFTNTNSRTVSYFYADNPDYTEHTTGIYSKETEKVLKNLNNNIEGFKKKLSKDTLVIVTADHGLTDVEPIDIFANKKLVNTLQFLPSIEPRASTFFIKDGLRDDFERIFKENYSEYFHLYSKEELLKSGILGRGKRHPLVEHCLGDYMSIAKDKYYLQFRKDKEYFGHHAGLTPDEMEVPLIVFRGDTV